MSCEAALAETGWGVYHYFLVALCGLLSFAEASASLTVPVTAPFLACDLKLDRDQATLPVATSSLGMAVGAFLFGSISDNAGRRKSIAITMGFMFCTLICLSFSQTNFLVNLSIFALGLGIAGNNTVLRVYLIEFLPARKRGACLAVIDMFWMVGYLSALGISRLLMPSAVRMLTKQFRPCSWRVLAVVYGVPSLMIACTSGLLPSSPRHLLCRRRLRQALTVLRQMYAINNSKHADTLRYSQSSLENCVRPDWTEEEQEDEIEGLVECVQRYFTKTWERLNRICSSPYRRTTLCGLLACLLHFPGFTWLALWNTHVLRESEAETVGGNGTCRVDVPSVALSFLRGCHEVDDAHLELLSLISLGCVAGQLLLIVGIDVVGRRSCLISARVTGAATSIALIFFRTQRTTGMVLSSIFLAAHAVARTATCVSLLENYPTALRGTMMGLTKMPPHLAVLVAYLFLRTTCLPTIIAVSVLSIGAVLAMLPVSDLTGLPMTE